MQSYPIYITFSYFCFFSIQIIKSIISSQSVETGRYKKVALNERLCQLCDCNAFEDEYHFVMNCSFHENLRSEFKQSFDSFTCLFNCDHDDIFLTLMSANNGDHDFVNFLQAC